MTATGWPHAPPHMLEEEGIYIVTGSTYYRQHFFRDEFLLKFLHDTLLSMAEANGWKLHAWAVFSNHYHLVGHSPGISNDKTQLGWFDKFHNIVATTANKHHNTLGRKVWHNAWDRRLTIHTSYLARLNYVHNNPVKHGLVKKASLYPWCSAYRFERDASPAFVKSIYSFDYTKVNERDDFFPEIK